MRFDLITIFPDFFAGPLEHGILRRARETGIVEVNVQDLRLFTKDRHRTVDDRPFGGGEGMVLKPEPLFEAVESLLGNVSCVGVRADENLGVETEGGQHAMALPVEALSSDSTPREANPIETAAIAAPSATAVVLLSASGKLFRQDTARRFARLDRIIFLCGRYEGVDERVAEHLATDELSIGDYVLSGGELAAALILDAVN